MSCGKRLEIAVEIASRFHHVNDVMMRECVCGVFVGQMHSASQALEDVMHSCYAAGSPLVLQWQGLHIGNG